MHRHGDLLGLQAVEKPEKGGFASPKRPRWVRFGVWFQPAIVDRPGGVKIGNARFQLKFTQGTLKGPLERLLDQGLGGFIGVFAQGCKGVADKPDR